MLNGIEVHQASKPDQWVVLMDQPFAGLVKELFEPQVYPAFSQRPYDVTGWTLPMQMGVEVHPVTQPPSKQYRDSLRPIHEITGLAAPFELSANASYRAINQILAAKGAVSLNGDRIAVASLDNSKLNSILSENRLRAAGQAVAPAVGVPSGSDGSHAIKPARVGLYRPWNASMDEGWTRWILEQYKFPFTNLYNADIRAGHLREHYDTIILPDIGESQILNGYRPGTVPERYAGGVGDDGAQELRDFVEAGGTLVTFNNASMFAVNQFKLPIENAIAPPNTGNFFCSGCLLSLHIEDAKSPLTAGMAVDTIVMFERGPVFNAKTDFKGKVLARYPRDRSPLESGYLSGANAIQGKIAALSADLGKGHIVLLGFKPQWRGQSHAAYKFFFNSLYVQE
jgi:hypothetical protein